MGLPGYRGWMRRSIAFVLAALSLVLAPGPASAQTPRSVPGIDVSQWQLDVDWAKVASTPVRFVIMRADKGADYVDPTYGANLAGASSAGLVVGAYHRATPASVAGDATAEADHFIETARNAAGDIVPVLDIEDGSQLDVAGLQAWVTEWVQRVQQRLGVRPMLYASPYFWRVEMGNSTWFARHGYPLWIAHWGVTAPDVPANDWAGKGWTVWQWTSTGTVKGITTDVDRDRFSGTDLTDVRIASITLTSSPGGQVSGSRLRCGGTFTRCRRLANPNDVLTLTATPDDGAVLLGWTGACAPAGASPTCNLTARGDVTTSAVFGYPVTVSTTGSGGGTVTSDPAGIACGDACTAAFAAGSTVMLAAAPDSASGFGGWSDVCSGSLPTCQVTVDGPVSVGASFDAAVMLDEHGAGTSYRWGRIIAPEALGGSYRSERRPGATVTYPFRGTAVSLFTVARPTFGEARVAIDGTPIDTIDGYAAAFRTGVVHRYEGLAAGDHTLTVGVLGQKAAASNGLRVGVDALRWGGLTRNDPGQVSAWWGSVTDPAAGGGAYAVSDATGATGSLAFTGTGVSLITVRGPTMGRAELWVDGVLARTIDLYAATRSYGVIRTVTGLVDEAHTVRVVVLGTHAARSTASNVVVDGWIVR